MGKFGLKLHDTGVFSQYKGYVCKRIYINICNHISVCVYVCACVNVCVCMSVYMPVCECLCTYKHVL